MSPDGAVGCLLRCAIGHSRDDPDQHDFRRPSRRDRPAAADHRQRSQQHLAALVTGQQHAGLPERPPSTRHPAGSPGRRDGRRSDPPDDRRRRRRTTLLVARWKRDLLHRSPDEPSTGDGIRLRDQSRQRRTSTTCRRSRRGNRWRCPHRRSRATATSGAMRRVTRREPRFAAIVSPTNLLDETADQHVADRLAPRGSARRGTVMS